MTYDGKRFLRRELINAYLRAGYTNIVVIMALVRVSETIRYGRELNLYNKE